jgi:hypothetical protein
MSIQEQTVAKMDASLEEMKAWQKEMTGEDTAD